MIWGTWIRDRLRRLRYVFVALAVALLVSFPNLLSPLDLTVWTAQSKLGHKNVSGDVVFVEVPDFALSDDTERAKLADLITDLERKGARSLFLDLSSRDTHDFQGTDQLKETISLYDNVYVVGRLLTDTNEAKLFFPPTEAVGDAGRVVSYQIPDFFGYIWRVPTSVEAGGQEFPTLSATLIDREFASGSDIEIDYRFDSRDIATITSDALKAAIADGDAVRGKSFVFGYATGGAGGFVDVPDSLAVPRSYVAIFAAETHWGTGLRRIGTHLFDYLPFLAVCVLIVLCGLLFGRFGRKLSYAASFLAVAALLIGPVYVPIRTGTSGGIAFLMAYAIQLGIARWRASIALDSPETGLPTLARLERDIRALSMDAQQVLICAKIHNFSEAMAALPASGKVDYLHGIVRRLRVGDKDLKVYTNSGAKLFWLSDVATEETLRSHLAALRAIFKNPLRLDDKPIDIAITFGVDESYGLEGHRRISIADALADKSSLSSQPIIFGTTTEDAEDEWKISLQSKIDDALASHEIFPVFQPQVDLRSGKIIGYEGLVRWHDHSRGFINPSYFIEQCEQAGRIDQLQQFMLSECISQFKASQAMFRGAGLSINVSATLLLNTWLTEIVEETLLKATFPADRLVLEITETARIHDLETARAVLSGLSDLGVGISLDDFGTGSAGLENFYLLPFTEIKVDRLFTGALTQSKKAYTITKNAIELGRDLGLRVVCEGVENEETLAILSSLGCEYAQGYLFGRPDSDINSFESKELSWLRAS